MWISARGKCLFDKEGNPVRFVGFNRDITEQRNLQQSIIESELKFRQIAENIREVFWIGSPAWDKIIYISPAFEEVWGEPVSRLYNNPFFWLESIHPDDRNSIIKTIENKSTGNHEDPAFPEYRIIRPDNSIRWIHARSYPVIENGIVTRIVGIAEDITQRKMAQEQLAASRRKYKSILDTINDAFFSLDKNFNFTYFNSKAEKILGKKSEEVLGKKIFYEIFTEAKGSIFEEKYTQALIDKKTLKFETYFGIEPYTNWYEVNVYPSEEGISVFFTVTTERKNAEIALQESERFNRHITEVLPMILYVYDLKSGKNIYLNKEIQAVLGFTPDDVINLGDNFMPELMHPEDFSRFVEHTKAVSQLEEDKTLEFRYRMRTSDGLWRWFTSRDSVFKRDEDGNPEQILGAATDITDQMDDRESLQNALQENRGLLQELQHRVKNSFSMISGMTELMKSSAASEESLYLLDEIQSKIEAVSNMYNLLYDTGSIHDVRLDNYIQMIIDSMPVTGDRITFSAKLTEIEIPVKTAIPVGIITSELLTNSIKHGFPESRKGTVKINMEAANGTVRITITDNGAGIPENVNISQGDSLGMKLIQALTKQIGGTFSVENCGGTCSTLEFSV